MHHLRSKAQNKQKQQLAEAALQRFQIPELADTDFQKSGMSFGF
jgi:hypothetical protein